MSDGRRPLSTRAWFLLVLGIALVTGLMATSAWLARKAYLERRSQKETRATLFGWSDCAEEECWQVRRHSHESCSRGTLAYGRSQIPGHIEPVSDFDALTNKMLLTVVKDGWGRPFRFACPGPLHPHGWDLWSVGPNGVDEQGGGDDILVGGDVADVASAK